MVKRRAPSRRAELRLVAGFLVTAPSVAVFAFASYLALWYSGFHVFEGTPIDIEDSALAWATGVAIIAVLVTVFGAVPTVVWMLKRGPLSLAKLVLVGAALGNVPFAVIVLVIVVTHLVSGTLTPDIGGSWYGLAGAYRAVSFGLAYGVMSAVVFWAVAVRGSDLEGDHAGRLRGGE